MTLTLILTSFLPDQTPLNSGNNNRPVKNSETVLCIIFHMTHYLKLARHLTFVLLVRPLSLLPWAAPCFPQVTWPKSVALKQRAVDKTVLTMTQRIPIQEKPYYRFTQYAYRLSRVRWTLDVITTNIAKPDTLYQPSRHMNICIVWRKEKKQRNKTIYVYLAN